MSDEKTREQLEAELVELRKDYEDAKAAEALNSRLCEKYESPHVDPAVIEARIHEVECRTDPPRVAAEHAKKIIARNNSQPRYPAPSALLALAEDYLRLRGIEVENG